MSSYLEQYNDVAVSNLIIELIFSQPLTDFDIVIL